MICNNLNPSFNPTEHPFQLVGWFIFGSFLILMGAFLKYLDDGILAQLDGELPQLEGGLAHLNGGLAQLDGSRVRWGRSVEVDQGIQDELSNALWNAEADHQGLPDEYSHSFVLQLAVSVIHQLNSKDSLFLVLYLWSDHQTKHTTD